jgi:hypothetical protein
VFGCACRGIADGGSCSATTLRDRRDGRIACGAIEALRRTALEAYDRFVGLELAGAAVWTGLLHHDEGLLRRGARSERGW